MPPPRMRSKAGRSGSPGDETPARSDAACVVVSRRIDSRSIVVPWPWQRAVAVMLVARVASAPQVPASLVREVHVHD